jgi:vacuolar-type H+-ATPase subunit H
MERVWTELKKIEAEAAGIRSESAAKAKEIIEAAMREADRLRNDAKIYAAEEAKKLRESTVEEANKDRDRMLSENEKTIENLRDASKAHVQEAVSRVFHAVLENKSFE